MVNTANAEGRVYRAERSHGKKNRRKFSSIMAMVLGAIVTIEIMIMGAMVLKLVFILQTGLPWHLALWYYIQV